MKLKILFIIILFPLYLCAQHNTYPDGIYLYNPDDILVAGDELPKILLVGSFHFAYYGLDAHVTKEEDKVDILSPTKQKEIEELVDYIAKFKPTKIVVEGGRNTGYIIRRYEEYQIDKSSLRANEIDQIGFRLMDRFELDTLYGADSASFAWYLENGTYGEATKPLLDSIFKNMDYKNDSNISKRYTKLYDLNDKMTLQYSMLDMFKFMNSRKSLDRGYGAYLVGDFKNEEHDGADALAIGWYSRNLRIMRNIQNITTSPEDRILVLFGAGHMTILTHLFECSPEYELVKFNGM